MKFPFGPSLLGTVAAAPSPRRRITLWRLHGATDELVCIAVVTAYGYALALELAGEPILLELQRSPEVLTSKASRLETWLLTQGWRVVDAD